MFSYVFCHRMKLIQDAIRLPLAWPYDAVIMGLWLVLLSEKPSKQGCRTTNSEDGFQAFQRPKLHYIWFGGEVGY